MATKWILFTVLISTPQLARAAADSWEYPIANWSYVSSGGFPFGAYNGNFGGYHLAHDTNVDRTPTGTIVVAPAEGVVKFADLVSGYGSSACNGRPGAAGYVVVIEHTFSNGTKVCSTFGHVQGGTYNQTNRTGLIPVGASVQKGQYIARVADYGGCPSGNWHHLHFGIRKNAYSYPSNLAGYTKTQEGLQKWHEPNAFVAARSGGGQTCASPGGFVQVSKAPDFDGNRRSDIARFYPAVGKWSVALSTGQSFLPFSQWTCGHGVGSSSQMVGDVNGDQLADSVVYFADSGSAYVALSTGSGFAGYYLATSTPVLQGCTRRWLEDVNGDGKTDIVGYVPSSGSWYVALSNGQQFVPQVHAMYGHGIGSNNQFLTYVNYDWRVDAVVYFASSGSWYVAFGQPDGRFSAYTQFASGHGVGSDEQYMADINGDVMNEAICYWNSFGGGAPRVIAWNSDGTRFVPDNNPRTTGQSYNAAQRIFSDFNGDYRADFAFWYESTGWLVALTDGYGFSWATGW